MICEDSSQNFERLSEKVLLVLGLLLNVVFKVMRARRIRESGYFLCVITTIPISQSIFIPLYPSPSLYPSSSVYL